MKQVKSSSVPPKDLRIACLLPSATAICLALGLEDHLVGVTHECQGLLSSSSSKNICILTKNGLADVATQSEIHEAVSSSASASASASCSIDKIGEIPSFYPLLPDQWDLAKPNVIFTQDLCAVCAPTTEDVQKIANNSNNNNEEIIILSLQPTTLHEVADTFVTVAKACQVIERGVAFRDEWWCDLERLQTTIRQYRQQNSTLPKLFLLEWLDPVFDSGHWTYQMMDFACVEMANSNDKRTADNVKSKIIEWQQVYQAEPDVVVVGCCGFDLDRNVQDARAHADQFASLTAKIFACDGNSYIAQPGPSLLQGVAVLAQCAYHDQPQVLKAIENLQIIPPETGFRLVDVNAHSKTITTNGRPPLSVGICDMEDLVPKDGGFTMLHEKACQEGKYTYGDPETGYQVFTELAHKDRGYCCGSGCRHCPFNHKNVGDKANKIQQPAILYQQSSGCSIFSLKDNSNVKILFHSGGKDSFLAIRALAKSYKTSERPFGLVLLTTFDASSRNIAHQNIPIDDVIRQAKHIDITLLGVPLRRSSGETYTSRIQKGLEVVQVHLPRTDNQITSLVFGDLHLQHIKSWRDKNFNGLGYRLEYPLWKKDYSVLLEDLEKSQVPCFVSASSVDLAKVGSLFNRQFYKRMVQAKVDGFGEAGEFHTLAKVWEVPNYLH